MTGNQILTRSKKKLKDSSTGLDWTGFFADAIDEVFSAKEWRFARQEIAYIHPQYSFEYQLNNSAAELSINKLIAAYCATSYSLFGGIPVPTSGTGIPLTYYPYAEFLRDFPEHITNGRPQYITEIVRNDGTNGAQIGIYERPLVPTAVWLYADCQPSYTIDDLPLAVLPKQFHRMLIYKIVEQAAEEKGMDKLSSSMERKFDKALYQLDIWDSSQPIYTPRFQPYRTEGNMKGVRYPGNFPVEVSR